VLLKSYVVVVVVRPLSMFNVKKVKYGTLDKKRLIYSITKASLQRILQTKLNIEYFTCGILKIYLASSISVVM